MKEIHSVILAEKKESDHLAKDLLGVLNSIDGIQNERETGGKSGSGFEEIATKIIEAGGLAAFVNAIITWLGKDRSRSLKLQIGDNVIEASNLTPNEQQELIEWFKTQTGISLAIH